MRRQAAANKSSGVKVCCCHGALARPSGRAQQMLDEEPSLTVGLVPRSASRVAPHNYPTTQIEAATCCRTPNVPMNPTIMKFGGTSVEDAVAFRNVAAIVKAAVPLRPVVVVSAIAGFTNALLATVRKAIEGDARAATRSLD